MNDITLKGSYNDEPLIIEISRPKANITQVIIQLGYLSDRYSREENGDMKTKKFFGGLAFCHPKDSFDILTGAKLACRDALGIGNLREWKPEAENNRLRAIYRACRELISRRKLHDEMANLAYAKKDLNDLKSSGFVVVIPIKGITTEKKEG